MSPNFGFPNMMFSIIPILFFCVFAIVIISFISTAIRGVSRWSKNNNQPVLIVPAKLISKRTNVSSRFHNDSDSFNHHHVSTFYYLTFEVESGSRMEFQVDGQEYGLVMEMDMGRLKFQGTRYLGFERTVENSF